MSECTREEGTNGMGSDAGEGEDECRVGSACGTPSATEGGACPFDIECDGDGDKSFKDMKNKNMSSSGNMRHDELQGPVLCEHIDRGTGNELETEADENHPATLKSKRTKKRKTKTAGADKAKSGPSKSFLQKELQRATEDNMRMMKLLKSKSKLVAQKKAEVDALMEQNKTLERRVNEMESAQEGGRQREESLGQRCCELEKNSSALAEKLKESEKRADEERKALVEQWRADDYEQRYTRLIREIGYRVRGMVADRSENQAKRMNTQKGEIEGKKKIKRRLKVKEKEEKDVCRKLIVCFRQIRSSIERQQRKQEEERKERNLSGIDTVHNNNNNNNDSDDDDDDDDDHKEDGDRKEKSGTEQREEGEERTTESGQDIIAGVLSETVARVAFQVEEERLHLALNQTSRDCAAAATALSLAEQALERIRAEQSEKEEYAEFERAAEKEAARETIRLLELEGEQKTKELNELKAAVLILKDQVAEKERNEVTKREEEEKKRKADEEAQRREDQRGVMVEMKKEEEKLRCKEQEERGRILEENKRLSEKLQEAENECEKLRQKELNSRTDVRRAQAELRVARAARKEEERKGRMKSEKERKEKEKLVTQLEALCDVVSKMKDRNISAAGGEGEREEGDDGSELVATPSRSSSCTGEENRGRKRINGRNRNFTFWDIEPLVERRLRDLNAVNV